MESSRIITVVISPVKEGEKGGQGHTQTYCISLLRDTVLRTHIVFMQVSSTSCFVLSEMDGKI
jgi:hypothetical protein